jgi:putative transposase
MPSSRAPNTNTPLTMECSKLAWAILVKFVSTNFASPNRARSMFVQENVALREAGETCSKHRVMRLMRVNKIRAVRGYRVRHSSSSKPSELIPNLLKRNFDVASPNKAWVTDIAYIRTWQGWLYLAVVMDLFSRKIVGWSMRPTIARKLVLDAVLMAVRRRRPRGTVIHSDQGSQYGSDDWRRFCKTNHLEPSMSRRGNCWDTQSRIYTERPVQSDSCWDWLGAFALTCRLGRGVPRQMPGPSFVT